MNMISYEKAQAINKNRCPNFTGVAAHGNRMILDIDSDTACELGAWGEGTASINIFEDGTIIVYGMDYDNYTEEWVEEEADKKVDAKHIDAMLFLDPIADYQGNYLDSYDKVVAYLKAGKF